MTPVALDRQASLPCQECSQPPQCISTSAKPRLLDRVVRRIGWIPIIAVLLGTSRSALSRRRCPTTSARENVLSSQPRRSCLAMRASARAVCSSACSRVCRRRSLLRPSRCEAPCSLERRRRPSIPASRGPTDGLLFDREPIELHSVWARGLSGLLAQAAADPHGLEAANAPDDPEHSRTRGNEDPVDSLAAQRRWLLSQQNKRLKLRNQRLREFIGRREQAIREDRALLKRLREGP